MKSSLKETIKNQAERSGFEPDDQTSGRLISWISTYKNSTLWDSKIHRNSRSFRSVTFYISCSRSQISSSSDENFCPIGLKRLQYSGVQYLDRFLFFVSIRFDSYLDWSHEWQKNMTKSWTITSFLNFLNLTKLWEDFVILYPFFKLLIIIEMTFEAMLLYKPNITDLTCLNHELLIQTTYRSIN